MPTTRLGALLLGLTLCLSLGGAAAQADPEGVAFGNPDLTSCENPLGINRDVPDLIKITQWRRLDQAPFSCYKADEASALPVIQAKCTDRLEFTASGSHDVALLKEAPLLQYNPARKEGVIRCPTVLGGRLTGFPMTTYRTVSTLGSYLADFGTTLPGNTRALVFYCTIGAHCRSGGMQLIVEVTGDC